MTKNPQFKLSVCPGTLESGHRTYSRTCLRRLFDGKKVSHILPFKSPDQNEETRELFIENRKQLSISGVQEKIGLILEKNRLRLTANAERSTYLLKPIPRDLKNVEMAPANEHLTMQIARQVYRIDTAENALIFFENGIPAYITRRFDVDAEKNILGKEDFATLAGHSRENAGDEFKYNYSYEAVGELIKKYIPTWKIEVEKFYSLVLFNFLFSNGDAHLKNFSILEFIDGDYRLAPAYDLVNTRIHIDDDYFALSKGLFEDGFQSAKYASSLHPARLDFIEFGKRIGVMEKRIDLLLAPFAKKQSAVYKLTENSFLDDNTKRSYLNLYERRRNLLNAI